jgi:peptidoglycan lytic transglycosylase D
MAIHLGFRVSFTAFLLLLASGIAAPAVADPNFDSQTPSEIQLAPRETVVPTGSADDAFWVDLSVERPLVDPGSVRAWLPIDTSADAGPPYPLVLNPQVQHFLDRFTHERRDVVGLWFSRSSRYLGMMREVLRSRGLPEELAFAAMIESGFNPVAVSRAGAVGLWQFMASTARRYGLRVDKWVDERRDVEKSTFAAAAYFRDLYAQFGSWSLAQAAYNAGEVKVAKAIRATGSNDFWVLSRSRFLRRETKEYVPAIHAATMIARDPAQYGFDTNETTVMAFEIVNVPPSTNLRWLATTSGVSSQMLTSLNPTLLRGVTPPGAAYALKVPIGTGTGVLTALEAPRRPTRDARPTPRIARASGHPASRGHVQRAAVETASPSDVHVVRSRDTVSSIAKHYGVSVNDVLRWNSLQQQSRIRPGDRLRVTDSR